MGFKTLIIVGPFLMTATAASALFVAWRGLNRARHILRWAIAFVVLASAILVRALWVRHDGSNSQAVAAAMQVLGISATALMADGFAIRAGHPGLLRRSWPIWLAVALMLAGLHVIVGRRALAAAFAAFVQAGTLLVSARLLVSAQRRPTLAEGATMVVIVAVAAMRVWAGIQMGMALYDLAASTGHAWVPAIMIEPAFMGLVAMFLIASDLCGEVDRLVWTDPLTGIMNRAGFEDAATVELRRARFPDRPLSIAIADIDRFKAINDTHGHAAGDMALNAFAALLGRELTGRERIGRIGGEEFALLLPRHDAYRAFDRVEPLRARAAGSVLDEATGMRLTACFGIAEMAPGESLESLIDRADRALYRCKEEGRNRCALASVEMGGRAWT